MIKKALPAIILTVLSSSTVLAEQPSYTFVDITYSKIDEDGYFSSFEADGIGLKGSLSLGTNFYITAELKPLKGESISNVYRSDLDFDSSGIGFGYRVGYNDNSSWFAGYELRTWEVNSKIDISTLRTGVKSMVTEKLELNGSVAINSMDFPGMASDSKSSYQLGFAYRVSERFNVMADFEKIDNFSIINLGTRMSF